MIITDPILSKLLSLKELLSDPVRWTKSMAAKDSSGSGVDPNSSSAVCWCMLGGLKKVVDGAPIFDDPAYGYLLEGARAIGYQTVSGLNDRANHDEVLRLVDGCVTRRRQELARV